MSSERPRRLSINAIIMLLALVQTVIACSPQAVHSADSPGNSVKMKVLLLDPSCPGVGDFVNAEKDYRSKKIEEAKNFFLKALAEADTTPGKFPPLALGHANHVLGHCLDYLWEDDHGEKYFEQATKLYERIEWPPIPILGLGVDGEKLLDNLSSKKKAEITLYEQIDWSEILTTNYDWAEALYRNKKYEKAVAAYIQFLSRQNEAHLVAMCPMSNRLNNTYLPQQSTRHMVDAALQVFDKDSDTKLLKDTFHTLVSSALTRSNDLGQSLDLVRDQIEIYLREGKKDKAKVLAEFEMEALKDYLKTPGHNLDSDYLKAYPALIERMRTATEVSALYPSSDSPGYGEEKSAELLYKTKEYEKAVEKYLELLNKFPEYEMNLFKQKPKGTIGAPIARHLALSCLHIHAQNAVQGLEALRKAGKTTASYGQRGYGHLFFDPIQKQAETYFYSGNYKSAKQLFEIEKELAESPQAGGMLQEYTAYSKAYLFKISHMVPNDGNAKTAPAIP